MAPKSTSDTPPSSVPSWVIPLITLVANLVFSYGAFKYAQGQIEASNKAEIEGLRKELKDLREGPVAEYLADKRNAVIRDQQRLAAFEEAQARQYGKVAELTDQLKSSKP